MTMRLALATATVTKPDGSRIESVSVLTRMGRLVASNRFGTTVLDVAATAVVPGPDGSRTWTVKTEAGDFLVAREKGCGCG